MKAVVLFGRRNTGLIALSLLVAKGYVVKVISDGKDILWLAATLGCEIVDMDSMGEFDLVLSVHWNKIIPVEYFNNKPAINIHPCLSKYPGKDPISKYIKNMDMVGSVSSHWMIEKADAGEVIYEEYFPTPLCINHSDFYNVALPVYFRVIDETLKRLTK